MIDTDNFYFLYPERPLLKWLQYRSQVLLIALIVYLLGIYTKRAIVYSFLQQFPHAEALEHPTRSWSGILKYISRIIFGDLVDFSRGAGTNSDGFKWRIKQICETGAHVIRFATRPVLMVYKPEIITFLSNLDQCCVEKASSFKKIFDPSMKKGIIFQEGNQWKQNRRLFEPYTHFSKLKEYHKTFLEKTNKMFKKWEKLNLSDTGESFKIDEMIQSLTLNTFMVSLLGLDFDLSENKENNLAEAFIVSLLPKLYDLGGNLDIFRQSQKIFKCQKHLEM